MEERERGMDEGGEGGRRGRNREGGERRDVWGGICSAVLEPLRLPHSWPGSALRQWVLDAMLSAPPPPLVRGEGRGNGGGGRG